MNGPLPLSIQEIYLVLDSRRLTSELRELYFDWISGLDDTWMDFAFKRIEDDQDEH